MGVRYCDSLLFTPADLTFGALQQASQLGVQPFAALSGNGVERGEKRHHRLNSNEGA
jgi:hypothetical protein